LKLKAFYCVSVDWVGIVFRKAWENEQRSHYPDKGLYREVELSIASADCRGALISSAKDVLDLGKRMAAVPTLFALVEECKLWLA
jgi:hypothetical protein